MKRASRQSASQRILVWIESYLGHSWYPALVGFCAGIDLFVLVIPTDALLVAGVWAQPRRWVAIAFIVTFGSVAGAAALAACLYYRPDFIHSLFPAIFHSERWNEIELFLQHYGWVAIFLGALGPLPQQPFVVIGALSEMPWPILFLALATGRLIKYLTFASLTVYAPQLLRRISFGAIDLPVSLKQHAGEQGAEEYSRKTENP